MEGEKLVHIWFVFEILELVVNIGNFKRTICTCLIGMMEILNLKLRYKFGWESCTR